MRRTVPHAASVLLGMALEISLPCEADCETVSVAIAPGCPPLRVVASRQLAHAAANSSACGGASGGDATGLRTSGGASRLLCHLLLSCPQLLDQAHVLELGCGLALAGLFAARDPRCVSVTLTDGDDRALAFARRALALNPECVAPVALHTLRWGEPLPFPAPPSPLLVLGGDVVYYAGGTAALLTTLAHLLAAPGSRAALAFNPRYPAWRADLVDGCAAHGLSCWELAAEAVLPLAEQGSGFFCHTRLVLLARLGAPLPVQGLVLTPLALEPAPATGDAAGWAALGGDS